MMIRFDQRTLTLLVAFPIFMVVGTILAIFVLRKDPKYWANRFFALAFLIDGVALFFNLFYLFAELHFIIMLFNFLSITCLTFGTLSLMLGIFVIYWGEQEVFEGKKAYIVLTAFLIAIVIEGFIGLLPGGISVRGDFVPVWSLTFGIYQFFLGEATFVIIFYFSIKLYLELTPEMRKKFRRFIIGMIFVNITVINVTLKNMYIIPYYEDIFGSLLNFGAFIGIILIYFGLVRR